MEKFPLNTGANIPSLGFGTWQLHGEGCYQAVRWALETGYRHLDTARIYGNEEQVGRAVKDSGLKRADIFITTKLWPSDFWQPARALKASLARLGLDYVDLYLIHWPRWSAEVKLWRDLEELRHQGLAKAIGVSNFSQELLTKLIDSAATKPAVNQIELTPYHWDKPLTDFCQEQGIVVEAYSPLGRGNILKDPVLTRLANKYAKTPAQLLLRWNLQHTFVPLPKSGHQDRIKQNFDVFDFQIDPADMSLVDSL